MAPNLSTEAWTQIRYDYEHSERTIEEICAEHGISSGTLRDRMRRWGWARRREPIALEGPPPLPAPRADTPPPASAAPPPPAARVVDAAAPAVLRSHSPHPAAASEDHAAPGEIDDGALVARLQSAVARVLPAIEQTVERLAGGAAQPREMEHAGRALGALTRTLRELNGLLRERQAAAAGDDDDMPEDIDAFRYDLARRMDAFVAARTQAAGDDALPSPGDDALLSPGEVESESAPPSPPRVRSL